MFASWLYYYKLGDGRKTKNICICSNEKCKLKLEDKLRRLTLDSTQELNWTCPLTWGLKKKIKKGGKREGREEEVGRVCEENRR